MFELTESQLSQLMNWLYQFFWPFLRVGGVLLVAPILGDNRMPPRVKIGLCVVLTIVIVPVSGSVPVIEPLSAVWFLVLVNQIIIGIAIGFMLQLVFNAMVVAGESLATTMGLGYALMNDPSNGVQVPIVSQFYTIFVSLLFLAFNGHHELIRLISESFLLLPVGVTITGNMLWHLTQWSAILFSGALQVALPALAALLTVNLVLGIMTRSAPQLNIFSVGFPIAITVGFIVIMLTLPSVAGIFQSLTLVGFEAIRIFLEAR
jgi:flagellar biosynthetic protein FliR